MEIETDWLAYVHITMSHRADDCNVSRLLERQSLIVILQQDNRLLIQLSRKLHSFVAVN